MTKSDLIYSKSTRVIERLDRIGAMVGSETSSFVADQGAVDLTAFYLFLCMQECIDIACHIIGDQGWGAPSSLAEAFDIVHRHGVISADTATAMRKGTKLRNLIAHVYGDVDPAKLHAAGQAADREIRAFLAEVGTWISK